MAKNENPKITEEHRLFDRRVSDIARRAGEATIRRLTEVLGTPENEIVRRELQYRVANDLDFPHSDASYRRGTIAGSDFFMLQHLYLAEEALEATKDGLDYDLDYPGHIIGLRLRFDRMGGQKPLTSDYNLFTGYGTPPMLIGTKDPVQIEGADPYSMQYAGKMYNVAPNSVYLMEATELRLVRMALEQSVEQVNIAKMVSALSETQLAPITDDPWLAAARKQFPLA